MNLSAKFPTTFSAQRWRLAVSFLVLAGFVGCGRTKVVSIDGSSTVFLLSAAIAEEFNEATPDVKVVVSQSGTGGGFKKFAAGEIQICDASRPITEAEAAACEKNGIKFIKLEVAFDGLAVVVNPANDWCDAITTDQLKTIWRAEAAQSVTKWSDVNPDWPDVELELYGPGTDSGTYDYFTEVINGEAKSSRQDYSPSESDNALVQGVAGDKGSLGYFGLAYYAENTDKLKLLAVDSGGGHPNKDLVRTRCGSGNLCDYKVLRAVFDHYGAHLRSYFNVHVVYGVSVRRFLSAVAGSPPARMPTSCKTRRPAE